MYITAPQTSSRSTGAQPPLVNTDPRRQGLEPRRFLPVVEDSEPRWLQSWLDKQVPAPQDTDWR